MTEESAITAQSAVAHFAAHIASAIREASSSMRQQRVASSRYQRARVISERITRNAEAPTPVQPGNEAVADQAMGDIQALSDALRHLPWLCSIEDSDRDQAVSFHRRVVEVLEQRMGSERCQRYRFDPVFLRRCLDLLGA